jgi:DNA-directed RNA polymerase subunit RPC12/RpoP
VIVFECKFCRRDLLASLDNRGRVFECPDCRAFVKTPEKEMPLLMGCLYRLRWAVRNPGDLLRRM